VPWYQMLQRILTTTDDATSNLSDSDPAVFEQIVRELSDGEPSPLSLTWIARIWGAVGPHQSLTHAIALLDTAASRCPADDFAVRGLIGLDRGSYHVSLGNFGEAAASFEEVIELAASDPNVPDHATALNNAAFLYAEYLDDPYKAADYARRAAVVRPNDPSILDTLGWALFGLGKYEEAEEQLKRSKAIRPSADNFLHLAWVYYETGRRGDVQSYLLKAEELDPSDSTQDQIDELRKKLKR